MNDLDIAERAIDEELETLAIFMRTGPGPFKRRIEGMLAMKRVIAKAREATGDTRAQQAERYMPRAVPPVFAKLAPAPKPAAPREVKWTPIEEFEKTRDRVAATDV